jgi:hypothetical protein
MLFPINTTNLNIIVIGDVLPQLVYGSNEPKLDRDGRPLFKVPVLISGTGDRLDPTTSIVVAGPIPNIAKGTRVSVEGLTVSNWTMKGNDGVQRSGISLRAKSIAPFGK